MAMLACVSLALLSGPWRGQGVADAAPPPPPLLVRVADPPPLSYDATALGHATHPIRLQLSNTGNARLTVPPLAFRFVATREGVTYPCEDPVRPDDRWEATFAPGEVVTLERTVACDTPLPGRYSVSVRARHRSSATPEPPDASAADDVSDEREVATFTMTIEPGTSPPVRLPWEPRVWAAATGTRDARPGAGASAGVRVVVGVVNGSARPITMPGSRVAIAVVRPDKRGLACAETVSGAVLAGAVPGGQMLSVALPVACDFRIEGAYELRVALVSPDGGRLPVATLRSRISSLPTPLPPAPSSGLGR